VSTPSAATIRIVTTEVFTDTRIATGLGVVVGIAVRCRGIAENILTELDALGNGSAFVEYRDELATVRRVTLAQMTMEAEEPSADAVVGVRFGTAEFGRVMVEVGAHGAGHSPWFFVFQRLLGIATRIAALALLYVIAIWVTVMDDSELLRAISMRQAIANEWLLGLAGGASIIFGVLVLLFPSDGAVGLVWAIGLYAIVFGVVLTREGVRLRGFGQRMHTPAAA